jgi:hypothetical protein
MLDRLREARESLHRLYCLPEDMWEEWIDDEQSLLPPDDDP